jgi:hypothetical protein
METEQKSRRNRPLSRKSNFVLNGTYIYSYKPVPARGLRNLLECTGKSPNFPPKILLPFSYDFLRLESLS